MGFLSPLFLVGLAALAVPVLLHLFRRETAPRVTFTAVRFLPRTRIEQHERRRIHDWWLLLLRAAAIALLVFAFARPYVVTALPDQPPVILALDVSYSMDAGTRLADARAAAADVLDGLAAGTPVALVAFADRATVIAEPTADHGGVRAMLGAVETGYGGTRYAAAVDTARSLLDGRPGRLVVFTDLQARGWGPGTAALPDDVALEVVGVGTRLDNQLVRDLTVSRDEARAVVSNAGTQAASLDVVLTSGDREAGRQRVQLDAGVSTDVVFPGPWEPGPFAVTLQGGGGFRADTRRVAVLDDAPAVTVQALVGDETERRLAFFLERAFDALGDGRGEPFAVSIRTGGEALTGAQLADADLVVWLGATGVDRRQVPALEAYVRDGGRLLVACGPALDARVADVVTRPFGLGLSVPGERRAQPAGGIVADDPRHPLLAALGAAHVGLGSVRVIGSCGLEVEAPAAVIARFSDGRPALAEARVGRGAIVVLATDLARQWNDLPVQPIFVPVVGELATYMLGTRDVRQRLVSEVPDAAYQRPGSWPIGPAGRLVAVNVDVAESDQAMLTREEFLEAVARPAADSSALARTQAAQAEQGQNLWRYGVMLLGAALVLESIMARRPRRAQEVTA
jgi:hypothetical protein